ncbi:PD-(D/E)XK nuclease family protein [Leucobacter allii]|uniref:PD-(D/E)XK nuclease family protein n=1 Tax=Leucobacter allii TaxID=2932247 RepID=UPI001FD2C177|nr:PD-(D/E)XK nuclease family protein [Leucobacter allii]UOR00330.1 PD-(D/E)XK nuclease family protein [Leucobacter allii]
MTSFDPSQLRVLELDPDRHARILGAPGSGKTSLLVEAYGRFLDREGWDESSVLALAPSRAVAADLRAGIERRIARALGGTPVRTAASLAFSVLSHAAARAGRAAPRLLTGTAQDEAIAAVIDAILGAGAAVPGVRADRAHTASAGPASAFPRASAVPPASSVAQEPAIAPAAAAGSDAAPSSASALAEFPAEVMRSPTFRAELRELWRVADDFAWRPAELLRVLREAGAAASREAQSRVADPGVVARWCSGLELIAEVSARLAVDRPEEVSSSALLREAADAIRADGVPVPRLLLVDDAQELGEGELALLAACAGAGSAIWVFGDPDIATGAFHGERTAVLARLTDELRRRGAGAASMRRRGPTESSGEQTVVLETVHRHGSVVRGFVRGLTTRIGAAGAGAQRAADARTLAGSGRESGTTGEGREAGADRALGAVTRGRAVPGGAIARGDGDGTVEFAVAASPAEQLGIIAHRLRARHLGIADPAKAGDDPAKSGADPTELGADPAELGADPAEPGDGQAKHEAASADPGPAPERGAFSTGNRPVDWSEMAVICRSRGEAARVARTLASHQVPTGLAAGGIVLREHQIVRELVALLRHALGIEPLAPDGVLRIVGGAIGGLDPVAVRRLRGALVLQERRMARDEDRAVRDVDALVAEAFSAPGEDPVVDSAGGRALRRLGRVAAAGARVRAAGGTPRETLWAIWDGTRLAERWQHDALDGRGVRADDAHRSLDAVLGLFFALQRHEEQDSEQPIAELLTELLASTVPEDTLARRSERAAVTVTTPQGAVGREFAIVAVIGVQDGAWPNLRARGSLLGTAALERWLRGGEALPPARRDTVHDELRLFAHACARTTGELLVVAVVDEDQHPSPFFGFGAAHRRDGLPSVRLTLRGTTAEMRRRLTRDPEDAAALASLVALARDEVPGARPEEWYGILPPSTEAPLHDLADPDERVPVSPSQLERAETCALDWAISRLGGGGGGVQASLGTLVHHALETAGNPDPEALLDAVLAEWGKLPFDADWESERAKRLAAAMTSGLAAYLRDFAGSDRRLIGTEAPFRIPLDHAELRGMADRLELRQRADGGAEVTVLDLKTGRALPSKAQAETHAQLQAYQLGIEFGAFVLGDDADDSAGPEVPAEPIGQPGRAAPVGPVDPAVPAVPAAPAVPVGRVGRAGSAAVAPAEAAALLAAARSGGARLLYVHPDAAKAAGYVERVQEPIDAAARTELLERVERIAGVMAGGAFTARVEHHCSDPHQPGACRLHIIRAVSHP